MEYRKTENRYASDSAKVALGNRIVVKDMDEKNYEVKKVRKYCYVVNNICFSTMKEVRAYCVSEGLNCHILKRDVNKEEPDD